MLKGQWTEESSQRAVRSWLKLTTSQKANIDLIAAQDDSMAMGARKAFQELSIEIETRALARLSHSSVATVFPAPDKLGCAAASSPPRSLFRRIAAKRSKCSWTRCKMENGRRSAP